MRRTLTTLILVTTALVCAGCPAPDTTSGGARNANATSSSNSAGGATNTGGAPGSASENRESGRGVTGPGMPDNGNAPSTRPNQPGWATNSNGNR